MAQMVTADGRMVNVPDGLEGYFRGLAPPPPIAVPIAAPPQLPSGGDPSFDPADTQALQAMTPPPTTPVNAPVVSPAQVSSPPPAPDHPPPEPSQRVAGAVTTPAEVDAVPGPPNTPKPLTDKSLQVMGEAGPMNVTLGAMEEQKAAAARLGVAQAAQATVVGNIETAANDAADKQLAQMKADAEANAKAVNDATALYLRNATALANTRIDHGIDYPVLAEIGTAMNILGTALNRQPMGDVMKPVYEAVDRKVAAQMQDIELGKANLALQRTGIDILRQSGNDKMQLQNTLLMSGLEQAKRRAQEIHDKTTSPIIAAQTQAAMADIDARKGELMTRTQASIQQRLDAQAARAQAYQIHREQLGVTIRGQNIQQAENDANRAERAQEHIDSIAEKLMLAGNAKAGERAKAIKDAGILDPVTGDYMLTDAGRKKFADADLMEAQIRKDPTPVAKAYIARIEDKVQATQLTDAIKDPSIATRLAQQYADSIRSDAQINDAAVARGSIKPDKVQEALQDAQNVTVALDSARKILESDPSAIDRKAWAATTAKLMVANADYVKTLGERVSVKALDAFNGVMQIDPDSWTSRTIDKGKAIEAIDALKQAAAQKAQVALSGAGIKTTWKPGTPSADVTADFSGKTAQEIAADTLPASRDPGDVAGYDPRVFSMQGRSAGSNGALLAPSLSSEGYDRALDAAGARRGSPVRDENGAIVPGPTSIYGLDPAVDELVRGLAKRADTAGHAAYASIVNTLSRPLSNADRPGLDTGVARLLRDTNRPLFNDVMAKVANDAGAVRAESLIKVIYTPVVPIDLTPRMQHKRSFVPPGGIEPEPVR